MTTADDRGRVEGERRIDPRSRSDVRPSSHDDEFSHFAQAVRYTGEERTDRTGIGTLSRFGLSACYGLQLGFPLLTMKKVRFDYVTRELLWMLSGSGDVAELHAMGCPIWNQWADKPAPYGPAWRTWVGRWAGHGVDQIAELEGRLRDDPFSRRHVVSAWNPIENDSVSLPPCHMSFQCYVRNDRTLDLHLYQRSADVFIGVPYNIASYALLTHMLAHVHGFRVGSLIVSYGDAHIYANHVAQVDAMVRRVPRAAPTLEIYGDHKSILTITKDDIELRDYDPHPFIGAPVAK